MLRFSGNTVAKNFRMGRKSQYRDCSSMSEKELPMGDLELFVDNMAGLFYKGATGVVGFVIGGFASTGVSAAVQKDEEDLKILKRITDERQMNMERMQRKWMESDRKYREYLSRKDTSV